MPLQFNEPPADRIHIIRDSIENAFKELPPGAKAGVFGVANEVGGNIVVATKLPKGIQMDFYVAKKWEGSYNYGVEVMKVWY